MKMLVSTNFWDNQHPCLDTGVGQRKQGSDTVGSGQDTFLKEKVTQTSHHYQEVCGSPFAEIIETWKLMGS
jgi:hypothetical protein